MTNENRPVPRGTPVKMNLVWSPDGLVMNVEGKHISLPYETSLRLALEAHGWLMAQLVYGLARPESKIVIPR